MSHFDVPLSKYVVLVYIKVGPNVPLSRLKQHTLNEASRFRASRSKKASKLAKMSNWLWQPKNDPQNRPLITIWSPKYKKMLKLAYQVFKVPNSDQK